MLPSVIVRFIEYILELRRDPYIRRQEFAAARAETSPEVSLHRTGSSAVMGLPVDQDSGRTPLRRFGRSRFPSCKS